MGHLWESFIAVTAALPHRAVLQANPLAIIASIVGPFLLQKLFGGDDSASGANGAYAPGSATQKALEEAALHRVTAAQPLSDAVLRMANSRLPTMYQAPGMGTPTPPGATPRVPVTADPPMPDMAADIIRKYRQQETGEGQPY